MTNTRAADEALNLEKTTLEVQMKPLSEICKENNLPMAASFAYENCEEMGVGCCTTTLTFEGRLIKEYGEATRIIRNEPQYFGITIMSGSKQ